jgi:uncharacterized phosphosugar-binding protein
MLGTRWVVMGALWFAGASAIAAAPGERLTEAVLGACTGMRAQRVTREEAAEAAAARFVQGGTLWVAGSIPRFDIEWLTRAGGIMPVSVMKTPADVGAADVLVYGCLLGAEKADGDLLRQVRARQGLVVAIGPAEQAATMREAAQFYLEVTLAADAPLRPQAAASASIAALWAFSGDLVGACTRRGVMPTMWQSVMVPGARERNARYRPLRVHADMTVSPQAAGALGERYLDAVTAALTGLRTQQAAIQKAGGALREAVRLKHTVFHANIGHFEPALLLPPDFAIPLTVLPGKDPDLDLAKRAVAGDALLAVWYTDQPTTLLKAARAAGVTSACILAANPAETRDPSLADIPLDSQWVIGDAVVEVPGYDVRILPPSGVLNSTIFFAILAEAQATP